MVWTMKLEVEAEKALAKVVMGGLFFPFLCVLLSGDESDSEAIQLFFETEERFCLDCNFPSSSSSSLESMYFWFCLQKITSYIFLDIDITHTRTHPHTQTDVAFF